VAAVPILTAGFSSFLLTLENISSVNPEILVEKSLFVYLVVKKLHGGTFYFEPPYIQGAAENIPNKNCNFLELTGYFTIKFCMIFLELTALLLHIL